MTALKEADLAGPGIGDYAQLEAILPDHYEPALEPRERWRRSTAPSASSRTASARR